MSRRATIDAPQEYKAGEEAAIDQLLMRCFGDTLPSDVQVVILRERVEYLPNTVYATVLVDGQEVGATSGTWLQRPGERPHACFFTLFPKYST